MTIEEKAKAYDEALLRIQHAYNSNRCTIGFMNEIFPCTEESEDERIRKQIICGMNALKDQKKKTFATIPIDNCIAWLERQGKPKWTDEDASKVKEIVYFLDTAKVHYASTTALDDCIEWLKSLKQRMEE